MILPMKESPIIVPSEIDPVKEKRREYQRDYAANYRITHVKKDRTEYFKAWYRRTAKERKGKVKAASAKRYAANKGPNLARSAAYHKRKKEEIAARKAAHRRANYARIRAREIAYHKSPAGRAADKNSHHRRRAQKFACSHPATPTEIRAVEAGATVCHYCGGPGPLTLDHFFPLSKGGSHAVWNLVMACKACNSRKSALMPWTWEKRSGFTFVWPKCPDVPADKLDCGQFTTMSEVRCACPTSRLEVGSQTHCRVALY